MWRSDCAIVPQSVIQRAQVSNCETISSCQAPEIIWAPIISVQDVWGMGVSKCARHRMVCASPWAFCAFHCARCYFKHYRMPATAHGGVATVCKQTGRCNGVACREIGMLPRYSLDGGGIPAGGGGRMGGAPSRKRRFRRRARAACRSALAGRLACRSV